MRRCLMECHSCHTTPKKESSRLPRGWKRLGGSVYCKACWTDLYCLRAIVMRVASPKGHSWQELRDMLKEQWIAHTKLANWCTTECYVRDVRRNGEEKMPGWKAPYLYPEARELFPAISPQAVASALNNYQAKYREQRYDVIWTSNAVLATYRYPQPLVCHNQAWVATIDEDDRPCVSVRIGDGRWNFHLIGGHRYRRQLASFRKIVSGEAVQGDLQIYRRRHNGPNGDGKDRDATQKRAYDICIKMVAWLPKQADRNRSGTLLVRTDSDSLLVALNTKDERLWVVNADQAKRWVAEHRRRLQRLSDDQKAEQRPVASFSDRRGDYARKFGRRMDSLVKETAHQLVQFADRRCFVEIRYDDTDQRFVDRFPYHALKDRVETICNERHITFTDASGPVKEKPQ